VIAPSFSLDLEKGLVSLAKEEERAIIATITTIIIARKKQLSHMTKGLRPLLHFNLVCDSPH